MTAWNTYNTSMTYYTVTTQTTMTCFNTAMKWLTMTACVFDSVHFSIEHKENGDRTVKLFKEICTILKFVKQDKNFTIFKEA